MFLGRYRLWSHLLQVPSDIKLSIACFISSLQNCTSSLVLIGSAAVLLAIFLFWCLFFSLSSLQRQSNVISSVCCMLVVSDPSSLLEWSLYYWLVFSLTPVCRLAAMGLYRLPHYSIPSTRSISPSLFPLDTFYLFLCIFVPCFPSVSRRIQFSVMVFYKRLLVFPLKWGCPSTMGQISCCSSSLRLCS